MRYGDIIVQYLPINGNENTDSDWATDVTENTTYVKIRMSFDKGATWPVIYDLVPSVTVDLPEEISASFQFASTSFTETRFIRI